MRNGIEWESKKKNISKGECMSVWINVQDKMPPLNESVLVLYKYKLDDITEENLKYSIAERVIDYTTKDERWSYFIHGSSNYKILYWTPLVDMPKIDKEDDNNKAMLIIDTPETCCDCKFCREINEGINACCEVMDDPDDDTLCRMIDCKNGYCHSKPEWCPIVEMPDEEEGVFQDDEYSVGYADGWNDFRRELLEER